MKMRIIEQKIADQIKNACGAEVEVTNRWDRLWTISGRHSEVEAAMTFLTAEDIMHEVERAECESTLFVYCQE